jgi:ABC-type nitrate/sulfonate/bicarbonate transport system substrate-binding protein
MKRIAVNKNFHRVLAFFLVLLPLSTAQGEVPLIRFGYIAGVTNAQRILIQERPQMFSNLGKLYRIDWLQFKGGPMIINAAAAGGIELGESTWPPILRAQVKNMPVITVADGNQSIKGKSFSPVWCALEDSNIKTVKDLKGKKLNVVALGGDYEVYLRMYLKRHGLDPSKDVSIVEIAQPFSVTALRSKTLDVVPLTTPQYFIEKEKGGIRSLFSNTDVIPEIQVVLIFARKSFLESGNETIKVFLSDYVKAAKYCCDNPLEAIRMMIKSKGLDPSFADRVQDFSRDPNGIPNLKAMKLVMDALYEDGMITKKLSSEEMADLRFLPKHGQ